MIQNPSLARAYDLAEKNWSELSDEDVRAFLWFVAKSFHILEGMFRQHRRGLLAVDVWEPYDRYIVGILRIEAVMGWWQSDGLLSSKEFHGHVESLLQATGDSGWRPISTADMVPSDKVS